MEVKALSDATPPCHSPAHFGGGRECTPGYAQALLLVLLLGITPGKAEGTKRAAGNGFQVCHIQGKCLPYTVSYIITSAIAPVNPCPILDPLKLYVAPALPLPFPAGPSMAQGL